MRFHFHICAWLALAAALNGSSQITETLSFTDRNLAIPDGSPTGLSDVQSLNPGMARMATISKLRVQLHIAGEFNGDLYAYLRHIQVGVTNFCVLLNRPGRTAVSPLGYSDAGLNVAFDSAATNGDIHVYRDVFTSTAGSALIGTWRPDGRLADPGLVLDAAPTTTTLDSFHGTSPDGEWTLFVADLESGATNMLVSWELQITGTPSAEYLSIALLSDNSFLLRFGGVPKRTYRIEYSNSLSTPDWTFLTGATADEVGTFEFSDTPPLQGAQRFYRSVYP